MHHEFIRNEGKPVLVCVPGLLGGPEDFRGISEVIQANFQVMYVDPNHAQRQTGLSQMSLEETQSVSYESSAPQIRETLAGYQIKGAYFLGISLGGKIVYDYAIRYPEEFLGAVISDVGPSSFVDSDLYRFVDQIVDQTDLNLPRDELKKRLNETIKDRNLRSLIVSQISYPNQLPPGIWKTGMKGLRTLLRNNSIDEQSSAYASAHAQLLKLGRHISVLLASRLSGITAKGLEQIRREWSSIRLLPVPDSAHFLHVTHKNELQQAVLAMIEKA